MDEFLSDLDRLIEEENKKDLQPGELTVGLLATRSGWGHDKARRILLIWEKEGIVEKVGQRREPVRGSLVTAWELAKRM